MRGRNGLGLVECQGLSRKRRAVRAIERDEAAAGFGSTVRGQWQGQRSITSCFHFLTAPASAGSWAGVRFLQVGGAALGGMMLPGFLGNKQGVGRAGNSGGVRGRWGIRVGRDGEDRHLSLHAGWAAAA